MRCTGVVKSTGRQCRWPATRVVGGLATCPYHVGQSLRLFREVERDAQTNPISARAILAVYREGTDRPLERT